MTPPKVLPSASTWVALVACAVIALIAAHPAEAHKRDFAWTYQWFTPYEGEKELELWITHARDGSATDYALEYEFAVNEHWALGLYGLLGESSSESLAWKGWKLEQRYRFGDYRQDKWLHAAYLELAKETDEPYELEGKWLLSRYGAHGSNFAVNLIAEKGLGVGEGVEWGYAAGWGRDLKSGWRAGVESKGSFTDREYYLGPTVSYDFSANLRVVLGGLVGLTSDSDDLLLRAVTEWEWF